MVVCVCNAIREKEVREAARNGARTARCIFQAAGCRPKCAQCVNFTQSIIANEQQSIVAA